MGVVFKARQVSMDRTVALKILSPKFSGDPVFIERFVKEARAAGQFSHENIVTAVDVGYVEPYHYFAMEYVQGKTLREMLKEGGALSLKDAVTYGLHIARALEHAWNKKIIHRDVKPDNVIVNAHGIAKLLDMGLACTAGAEAEEEEGGGTKEKKTRKALGTPHYISPEAARGEEDIDTRADLYSLGCTLYHLLTNATPFEGDNGRAIMAKHVAEEVPDTRSKRPEVPMALARLVAKLTAKERDDRYENPTHVVEDLLAFQDGKPLKHIAPIVKRGGATTGPRLPITGRGTTGPRTAIVPRSTTGPASPVIVGDRTGSLVPTQPTVSGLRKAEIAKANVATWIGIAAGIVILLGIAALVASGGDDRNKDSTRGKPDGKPDATDTFAQAKAHDSQDSRKVEVKSAGPSREDRLKESFEKALEGIQERPDEFPEHFGSLQRLVQQSRGFALAGSVDQAMDSLEKRWKDAFEAAIKPMRDKAAVAVKAGNYKIAWDALDDSALPENVKAGEWKRHFADARKQVGDQAETAGAKLLGEARAQAGKGGMANLQGAIEIANKVEGIPAPSATQAAKEIKKWTAQIEDLKRKEALALAERKTKALAAAEQVRKDVAAALAQGKYATALEQLDAKIADASLADAKELLQADRADVEGLIALRKRAIDSIQAMKGETISLASKAGKITGQVAANQRDGVTLKLPDGPEATLSADQLDPRDVDRFAAPDTAARAEDLKRRGLLFLAAGDPALARTYFEKARDAGLGEKTAPYFERLEVLALGAAEVDARKAWTQAEQFFAASKWKEANLAFLAFSADHGQSKWHKENEELLKQRLKAIDLVLNPIKPGLAASYFNDVNLNDDKVALKRIDKKIDFDWGLKAPDASVPKDKFAVRWQGSLKVPKDGKYNFDLEADDVGRVWIDGKLAIDELNRKARNRPTGDIQLTEGLHEIKVEMVDQSGVARCKLWWSLGKEIKRQIVPEDALFHEPAKLKLDDPAPAKGK